MSNVVWEQMITTPTDYENLLRMNPTEPFYTYTPPNTRGRLAVKIMSAKMRKKLSYFFKYDLYVKIHVGHVTFKTKTCKNSGKTPYWNNTIHAYLPHGVEAIFVEVIKKSSLQYDKCICSGLVILPEILFNGQFFDEWHTLYSIKNNSQKGEIKIMMVFTPDGENPPSVKNLHPIPRAPPEEHENRNELITDDETEIFHMMFPYIEKDVIRKVCHEKIGQQQEIINVLLEMSESIIV